MTMGNAYLQACLQGAQMRVGGAAQVRQTVVVERRKGVSDNQADNPMGYSGTLASPGSNDMHLSASTAQSIAMKANHP
jgi:hypothetical protein